MNGEKIIAANRLNSFMNYDFSKVWTKTENSYIYGIFGKDNQRLFVKILAVERDKQIPNEYIVLGKSKVKERICDFTGKIVIYSIQESERMSFGVDEEHKDLAKTQGLLTANYLFYESKIQKNSGVFKGQLKTKWYLSKHGKIAYDNINEHSDGYFNNAFVGNWQMYGSTFKEICNWADYRVPNVSCDFDQGVGEFSVSKRYWEKGWLDVALKNKVPNGALVETQAAKVKVEWWQ